MVETVTYEGFSGGINQQLPPSDIADNQVVDALNLELDQRRALRVRGGLTKLTPALTLTSRITSIFYYRPLSGAEAVLFTAGGKIYRQSPGATTQTDITNGQTLPASAVWSWAVLNDTAVGVNSATGAEVNPVKIVGAGGLVQPLGGSPPKSKLVAAHDSRLFLVSATEPNRIYWCALGNPEDWTTTGKTGAGNAVPGGNHGDYITALYAHRGRLFVFMRRSIWVLVSGSPNTDTSQWEWRLFSAGIGCVAAATIQPVLDDLVFLSDEGVVSLGAVEAYGDFRQAVLSTQISSLARLPKALDIYQSVRNSERSQYWLAVPEADGMTANSIVWVMDYSQWGSNGGVAWTRYDGLVAGSALGLVLENGRPRVYVGGASAMYRYGDEGVFGDDGVAYRKELLTKAFSPGPALWRKEFYRFGLELAAETDPIAYTITYRFDESDQRSKTISGSISSVVGGGVFGEAVFGTDTFATSGSVNSDILHRIQGIGGRRGQTVQFRVQNEQLGHGFKIKRLSLDVSLLSRVHVAEN